MSTLTLKGLSKSFGELEVISGIDLTVEEGEFVALVGPSGCGKSTILRMIAGLEAPTSGSIQMDDKEVNRASPRDRNIAMVFQNYALYPHMTVRQNMGLNLKVSGVSGKEIERKVTDAAKLLDVSELLDRRPAQLSGGQRQRVAMGRAIVRNPAVFLFDEPLSNLDAALRVQMRAQIKLLHDKVRTTSIYVTHDQIEAMTLADRVVVLRSGRVEQQGRPIELYEDPNNLFVATFIGSPAMNILDAEVVEDQGAPSLRLIDGTMLSLPETMRRRMGDAVQLGVRPEHLSMVHTHGDLVARLRYLEPTGAQTLMVLDIGDQQISVIVQGNVTAASGSMIHFSIPKDKRFLFDKETGERIRQDS